MSQTASSTALLILTQVASRALTFIGNQVVLQYSSPTLLGVAIQLELVSVTILYFARESLRVALQRQPIPDQSSAVDAKPKQESSQQLQGAVNASYLAVKLGLLISAASFTYYIKFAPGEVKKSPQFPQAVLYYILATSTELLSEPFFIIIQQQGLFRARASAETTAAINRCIFACSVALYTYQQGEKPSVLPFAVGQLAYGVTLFVLYYRTACDASRKARFNLLPSWLSTPSSSTTVLSLLPKPLLTLALTLYAQSTFKLLLTQGDALLLSFLAPLHSQGAFALASNYGGLLARLLFQPIEESSRNTFGALLSPLPTNATAPSPSATQAALTHLSLILHTYTLFSLPLLTLLPPLLPTLAPFALSRQWRTSETTGLLTSYIYYIPLTAINGVIDAFVTSVATPRQLHAQSLSMAAFTMLYGAAAWLFLNKLAVGARGLVWANAVGMVARIVWGMGFLRGWIGENVPERQEKPAVEGEPLVKQCEKRESTKQAVQPYTPQSFAAAALPHPTTLAASLAVWACLQLALPSQRSSTQQTGGEKVNAYGLDAQHLRFVATGALVLVVSILVMEMEFLVKVLREAVPRRLVEKVPRLKGLLDGTDREEIGGEVEGEGKGGEVDATEERRIHKSF